jgi:hypothetical protein
MVDFLKARSRALLQEIADTNPHTVGARLPLAEVVDRWCRIAVDLLRTMPGDAPVDVSTGEIILADGDVISWNAEHKRWARRYGPKPEQIILRAGWIELFNSKDTGEDWARVKQLAEVTYDLLDVRAVAANPARTEDPIRLPSFNTKALPCA